MPRLAIGSYTAAYAAFRAVGDGLSLLDFDSTTGSLALRDVLRDLPNPAYLRPHRGGVLLTVCEAAAGHAALAWVDVGERLLLRGRLALPGAVPCHVDVDPTGRLAAVACYASGDVLLCALVEDGSPSAVVGATRHEGSSVNPARQAGPHPHAVRFSPAGGFLIVPDLGTDHVWVHTVRDGALGDAPWRWKGPAGSGPRLLLFAPDGRHALLVLEMASAVCSLRWHDGRLELAQLASSLRAAHAGANTASGLRLHPSGRLFAVSNRGADRIALFSFDPADGAIALVDEVASGGAKPRDFEFSPCGRWLIAANQDGDNLAVFAVEGEKLRDTGIRHALRSPSCVRFVD
ncbi:MAG: lactonase family protein [Acetobacteraceae bacterium]